LENLKGRLFEIARGIWEDNIKADLEKQDGR
jgi:hypothetical protein